MRLLKDDLRELDLFAEASRSELAVIARQLTRLKVKAGRVLVREGGIGNEFMIMVSGMAEVTQGGRVSPPSAGVTWLAKWRSSSLIARAAAMPR
jgi:hypothetical protein